MYDDDRQSDAHLPIRTSRSDDFQEDIDLVLLRPFFGSLFSCLLRGSQGLLGRGGRVGFRIRFDVDIGDGSGGGGDLGHDDGSHSVW